MRTEEIAHAKERAQMCDGLWHWDLQHGFDLGW
jgi:hypothetical protein